MPATLPYPGVYIEELVWIDETIGQLVSRWKKSMDPHSGWTDWSGFQSPPNGATWLSVGYLCDKRMHLFATNSRGQTFSCRKTSTNPKARWTANCIQVCD